MFTGIRQDIERDRSRSIVDINVTGTANLLDLATTLSMERFLYVSSGSVYGEGLDPGGVLQEEIKLYPRTLYASTKYASELLTRRYGELHGFQTVSTRLSSPYGPMERVTGHRAVMSVLYEWTRDAVRGGSIRLGDRTASRDYTYVADTASAICSILDAPSLSYGEYNIASGYAHTLEEIARALKEARPSVEIVDDPTYQVRSLRPDTARGPMDVTRLREDVGFQPAYDLVSGIRRVPGVAGGLGLPGLTAPHPEGLRLGRWGRGGVGQLDAYGGRKHPNQVLDGPPPLGMDGLHGLRLVEEAHKAAGNVEDVSVDVTRLLRCQPDGERG